MSFTLPKPAVSSATVPTPDFSAATDAARTSGTTTQKAERSTFDTLLSRHADQVEHSRAAKPQAAQSDSHKARPTATEKHKPAEKAQDKPTAKAADKPAAKSDVQTTDTADAAARAPEGKADDTTAQVATTDEAQTETAQTETVQADSATPLSDASADASADAAVQAAALAAQAGVQVQVQTPIATADTTADVQLTARITPEAPKDTPPPAPAAPDGPAPDAIADQASPATDPKAAPADFAALLGQVANGPAPAVATPAQGAAKPGKAVSEKTAKADAAPVLTDLGSVAEARDTAPAQTKAAIDPATARNNPPAGDDKPTPADRFAEARGAAQPQDKPQTAPVQLTPQAVPPELAAATTATPRPADTPVQTAFSIQTTAADVPGGYSATGAQNGFSAVSATTLSRSAIENMGAMGLQISKKLAEGNTRFSLELHPADLGKVEVALNIGRDGKTTAHLRFDSPVTAAAFSANEGELRQQLANAGLTLDSDALTFSSRDGGGSGQAFAQMFQGQEQASHGQAARALRTASNQADQVDADAALDAALAEFRNRPAHSTLALNLVV